MRGEYQACMKGRGFFLKNAQCRSCRTELDAVDAGVVDLVRDEEPLDQVGALRERRHRPEEPAVA